VRERDRLAIKRLLGEVHCPKDFTCVASGLRVLCSAEDVGMEDALRCLEEDPANCPFARFNRVRWYCRCPLRVYLAKNLNL
jgi:hypothetical protein